MGIKDEKDTLQAFSDLGITPINLAQAKDAIDLALQANITPVLIGEAGIGKSAVIRQYAAEKGWETLFYYLAHVEREDILGIPFPNKDGKSYTFLTEENIAAFARSKRKTLLVLDEWNRGDKNTMNAAFTMIEDKRLGAQQLSETTRIIAAMNPSNDYYIVNEAEKDPAFRRRLAFIGVQLDVTAWLEWARTAGINDGIIDFIIRNPQYLLDTRSRDAGKVYANPAAWEKVNSVLRIKSIHAQNKLTVMHLIGGVIGAGLAVSFVDFMASESDRLNPADILSNYPAVSTVIKKLTETDPGGISKINNSIVLLLQLDEPKFNNAVADNLLLYMDDIPVHLVKALIVEMGEHIPARTLQYISQQLAQNAKYAEIVDELISTEQELD